jgi:eukaryotic translation initiation factor 2C
MRGFVEGCKEVGKIIFHLHLIRNLTRRKGIKIEMTKIVRYGTGHTKIRDFLKAIGMECIKEMGGPPQLYVVILPESGNDIYTEVK